MSNEKVINLFLDRKQGKTAKRNIVFGCYVCEGRTLQTIDNILYNYNTKIAKLENNIVYLNIDKYSRTTTKIQNMIRYLAKNKGLILIGVHEDEMR